MQELAGLLEPRALLCLWFSLGISQALMHGLIRKHGRGWERDGSPAALGKVPAPREHCRLGLSRANEVWLFSGQGGAWEHLPFLGPSPRPLPWDLHLVSWQTQLKPSGGSNAGQGGWQ